MPDYISQPQSGPLDTENKLATNDFIRVPPILAIEKISNF
jgi:hypothetical protein